MKPGLGKDCKNFCPSDSAGNSLEGCFAENALTYIEPHQQITGLNANQMLQFARRVCLKVSLAYFGMPEDLLLNISSGTRKLGGVSSEVGAQSPFPSKTESTVAESGASRHFYSLPTITESVASISSADFHYQQSCSSRQADDVSSFWSTQVTDCRFSQLEDFGTNWLRCKRDKIKIIQVVTGRSAEPDSALWFRRNWLCL